jgi:hypothetical protein
VAVKVWALATEDPLSEAVGRRLLSELPGSITIHPTLQRGGRDYLRTKMPSLRQMSRNQGVLVLTDLDRLCCPSVLLDDWREGSPLPPNLLLRIAVRTIEAWVLADHEAIRGLLGPRGTLPPLPDTLPNPKLHLLKLAENAPRDVRLDLVRQQGAAASQGLGYNARLTGFVLSKWSPERAAQRSPSLRRARRRLLESAGL